MSDEEHVEIITPRDSNSSANYPSATQPQIFEDFHPNTSSKAIGALRRREFHFEVAEEEPSLPAWAFPGYGGSQKLHVSTSELDEVRAHLGKPKHLLSQWPSTAISGNDLLSSCMFTAGIVALRAGKLSPIPNIMVAAVMYLFRFIYIEVVSTIPLNGGSYNALLNATSKRVAAMVAALAVIAYVATGVVGAVSASSYLRGQVPSLNDVSVSIGILFLFAFLNIIGISESSVIALGIFLFHILTLCILIVASIVYTARNPNVFLDNMKTDLPEVDYVGNTIPGNVFTAIFFGFSSAMLGVTGFETAANFVEEQEPGIFKKIIRVDE